VSVASRAAAWARSTMTARGERVSSNSGAIRSRRRLGLIRQQYDQMVKYATALRLGTAPPRASAARNRYHYPTANWFKAPMTVGMKRSPPPWPAPSRTISRLVFQHRESFQAVSSGLLTS
jgi:hypothetical protein